MKCNTSFLIALLIVAILPAGADTLYLKNGTCIHGVVLSDSNGVLMVQAGDRKAAYRSSEVAQIEKNDKTGKLDMEEIRERAKLREKELIETTGLSPQQHRLVHDLLKKAQNRDRDISEPAKQELAALGQKVDLFRYFRHFLPEYSPRLVAPVLEVLFRIDKVAARPILQEYVTHVDAVCRAAALLYLARSGDTSVIPLLAQGLIDHKDTVRLACAYGAGALKAKECTPLILANMKLPDPRLLNVGAMALEQIWSDEGHPVRFSQLPEWESYWNEHASEVAAPYSPEALSPLVPEDAKFVDE